MGVTVLDTDLLNEVRRERSAGELEQLNQSICDWIQAQRAADVDEHDQYMGRHKTQLEAIESVLLDALTCMANSIGPESLRVKSEVGLFFDRCRDVDMATLWLQRVWEFFKEKFDQRKDDQRKDQLLKAADEVVWSCYRQVLSHPNVIQAGIKPGPTPLPYIEAWYSPAARHSDKPLRGDLELKVPGMDEELASFLAGLPIPLLRLPPWCVDAPWWLVYIAHEIGHLVQHDLKLVGYFRQGMEAVASNNGLSKDEQERWGRWGKEIFADVFSVMLMGPWALWGIVEVEWTALPRMSRRRPTYPAPLVRLALMSHLSEQLKLGSRRALRGLDPTGLAGDNPKMKRDLSVVNDAVAFALKPLPKKLGTLKELCGFEKSVFAPEEKVERWAAELRSDRNLAPHRSLGTARLVMSGAVQAWADVIELAPPERRATREALADRTKMALIRSAAPGTRANLQPSGKRPGDGRKLADLLLQAGRQRLEPEEN